MRTPFVTIVALWVLSLSLPAFAQEEAGPDPRCILFIEPSPDFRIVRVRADLLLTDEERANLTAVVDANADGRINATEAAAYEASESTVVVDASTLGSKALYMDGMPPSTVTLTRRLSGWDRSPLNLTVTEHRLYDFPPPNDSGYGHVLAGGLYALPAVEAPRPVVETVVLVAPAGWVVWNVENRTNAAGAATPTPPSPSYHSYSAGVRYEARQVELPRFDAGGSYTVGFSREGTDPTSLTGPGPGLRDMTPFLLIGGVGALIIAAVVLAARRIK